MRSPERILEEGEAYRRKRTEYETALTAIRYKTAKSRWGAFGHILVIGALAWMMQWIYVRPDPMTKADGFGLVCLSLVIFSQAHLAIANLCRDPRDIALRNLIEEKLKEEK